MNKEDIFKGEAKLVKKVSSPCDKFTLTVYEFQTRPGCWSYTKGVISKDGFVIAEVERNYGSFWYHWVIKNEITYLICGEDYQGIGYVNCETGKTLFYLPEKAKNGHGFCHYMVEEETTIDKNEIDIIGCYWGGPEEIVTYDITNFESLPWPVLSYRDVEVESDDEDEE
jgi:hypothetical protein